MLKVEGNKLVENEYIIADEAKNSSIFGIGNGYFGIRGSFEEFGDVFIQGTYVRGVFDQIIEIPQTFSENSYMKSYYFDEQKLKEFEYEDSCINICDFTAYRIFINGTIFLPWKYEILSYQRYIDFTDGSLNREMVVKDKEDHITKFIFKKVASFGNNHLFIQSLTIEKVNHDLPIDVYSGVDTLVKTNGQKKSKVGNVIQNDISYIHFTFGDKYHMFGEVAFKDEYVGAEFVERTNLNQVYSNKYHLLEKKATFRKVVDFYANVDCENVHESCKKDIENHNYDDVYQTHCKVFEKEFSKVDIKIIGNNELDILLRYANYQTLIGLDRFDNIHSLSAKNLTAEKYNQFVWWDCEIYQLPYFLLNYPEQCKNLLDYRYRCLEEAKNNAKNENCLGAKFAFCSSVKGDEKVWIYARHPFLQIHINSDIAYGIINYYKHTLDENFLVEKGLVMIENIVLYFMSRSTKVDGKYQLKNVTGTDEHHDYVDNDAYTNYVLKYVLDEFTKFINKFNYRLTLFNKQQLDDFNRNLYLPTFVNKILPQFDGYLSLDENLTVEGGKNATNFQMKQSGLYHLSQIIKQPDVLLLYSYVNIGFDDNYKENYEFYLKRCEASSSLTFPVHTICAIDNDDIEEFDLDLHRSLKIDIDDINHCAYQGVHAGSLAGGYLAFIRGILGVKICEDYFEINPHKFNKIEGFKASFMYHGKRIFVDYTNERVVLESADKFTYMYQNKLTKNVNKIIIDLK